MLNDPNDTNQIVLRILNNINQTTPRMLNDSKWQNDPNYSILDNYVIKC